MARIKLYPNDTSIQGGDKLVGTDINGNATKNYQIEEIANKNRFSIQLRWSIF
jgi:hypothetical protein